MIFKNIKNKFSKKEPADADSFKHINNIIIDTINDTNAAKMNVVELEEAVNESVYDASEETSNKKGKNVKKVIAGSMMTAAAGPVAGALFIADAVAAGNKKRKDAAKKITEMAKKLPRKRIPDAPSDERRDFKVTDEISKDDMNGDGEWIEVGIFSKIKKHLLMKLKKTWRKTISWIQAVIKKAVEKIIGFENFIEKKAGIFIRKIKEYWLEEHHWKRRTTEMPINEDEVPEDIFMRTMKRKQQENRASQVTENISASEVPQHIRQRAAEMGETDDFIENITEETREKLKLCT